MKFKPAISLALLSLLLMCGVQTCRSATAADELFTDGLENYSMGEFVKATQRFQQSLDLRPASGTLLNLGIVQWRRGNAGAAILAWEKVLWMDPSNQDAKGNLEFARQISQLEAPDLAWYEIASTWLSANAWAWLAVCSLSLVVAMITLPQVFDWPKAGWHQATAALGLCVLLLSIPANVGIMTRTRLGFVLEKNTPLRLTPTEDAEFKTTLAAGEPARKVRMRGDFVFIRTLHNSGWLKASQLGLVSRNRE